MGCLNVTQGLGGGETLALAKPVLNGEARRDEGGEWGEVLPDGGVLIVGVGVLDG